MNKVFKNTSLYTIGNILPKLTAFILLPIYTSYLSPAEYGIVSSMQSLAPILMILFSLGFDAAIFRLYWDYKTKEEKKIFLGTIIISRLIFSFLFLVVILLLHNVVQGIYKSITFNPFYLYVILASFFSVFFEIPKKYLMLKGKAGYFVTLSFAEFLITSAFILWFIIYKDEGASGYLKGGLVSSLIFLPVYFILSIKIIRIKISLVILKNVLVYSLPIVPTLLTGWVIDLSDRIFIARYFSLTEVGIYSLAYKIAGTVLIISTAYQMSYKPLFFKLANSIDTKKSSKIINDYNSLYIIVLSFAIFLVAFFSKELILLIFNKNYSNAYILIPFIIISYLFNGMGSLVGRYIEQSRQTKSLMYIAIITTIINVTFNFLLIPSYGAFGAAYSTIITFIFLFVAQYLYAKYYCFFIPFNWRKIIPVLSILTLIFLLFKYTVFIKDLYIGLIIKLGTVLIIGIIFWKKNRVEIKKLLLNNY